MASTDIEVSETYDKMKKIQEVGVLHLKGYNNSDIAELLDLDTRVVKRFISEYLGILKAIGDDNPYFLEDLQYNTLKFLSEFNELSKEAWETVEIATREGMLGIRLQALKLAGDMATKKANLHQLMTGASSSDGEYIARMQKAESVNGILSKVLRDVVSDCEVCRPKARQLLREAFAMMESEGFESAEEAADSLDFENGEVVDEES